jgi:carboxypeptidase Taq
MSAYIELKHRYEAAHILNTVGAVLMWDQRVMMPPGSGDERIAMHQVLNEASRLLYVGTAQLKPLLQEALLENPGLPDWDQKNLAQMVEANDDPPLDIVPNLRTDLRATEMQCRNLWPLSREANDWNLISKPFGQLVYYRKLLNTAIATAREEASAYDISLSHFTRRWRTKSFDHLIDTLLPELKRFLATPHNNPSQASAPLALAPSLQLTIMKQIITDMGFDFTKGRLDVAPTKAFFAKTDHDRRIVTRLDPVNALANISSTIHETGHALHYQYLPEEWRTQPVGRAGDMCMREAVALFWQIYVAQTPEFSTYLSELLEEYAQVSLSGEELYQRQQYLAPSPLRVGSDPATYALHILIRYQIERDLINGTQDVNALPQRWAYDYAQALGVAVPNDAMGVLQDIHWFKGSFGYFPCYLLALLYAAQMFAALERDQPDLRQNIATGHFAPIVTWLRDKVYSWANFHDGLTLLENATGETLNPKYFTDYLNKRYG